MSTDRTIDADDRQAIRTCHICEVSCGLALQVRRDGTVASVRGDAFDTYSSGYLCAKGAAIGALDADPDRLLEPRIRRNGRLEVVGWDEAFAEVDRLLRPHLDGNRSTLALFTGNPSGHNFAGTILQPALEAALGTPNKYSVSTIDQMPQTLAATLMYGGPTAVPIADVDRTDHMVIVGANPFVSNGSLGGGPRYPQRIRAIRERGGSVVVIDPATTRTARAADRHIAIRPGTDAMLLLSVVRELFVRDAIDLGNAAGKVNDLDAVRSAVSPFTPGAVATPCGVDPGVVGTLADGLITARTAVVYGRTGTTLNAYGTLTSWAIQLLNVLTGNLDRAGGAMFTTPAVGSRTTLPKPTRARRMQPGPYRSRVRRAPALLGELPAACLAEDILEPGVGPIRGLITFAGNVARSIPSSDEVERALEAVDVLICIDPYLNETTRFADVILPPAPPLTRSHYDIALYAYAIRNVANYSPPVRPVPPGAMAEWDILLRLIDLLRAGGPTGETHAIEEELAQDLAARIARQHDIDIDAVLAACTDRGPERLLDMRLRSGPYGDMFGRRPGRLSLDELRRHPHGIDFGPLQPRLDEVLDVAPSGQIELAPEEFLSDLPRLREHLDQHPPADEIVLIGRRGIRSMNSSIHNVDGLAGKDDRTLHVNPVDAGANQLEHGGSAWVSSGRGRLRATVTITDSIMPGVCSLPHGFGHGVEGTMLSRAAAAPGANANVLTDDRMLDPLSGTAALNGTPVTLAPAVGAAATASRDSRT